jgi:carboxylesterase
VPLAAVGQLLELKRLVRPLLPRVSQPVLALHGRGDQAVPIAVLDILRAELGSRWIETEILERSWHVVTLDVEREHVATRTADFLERVEAAAPGSTPALVR